MSIAGLKSSRPTISARPGLRATATLLNAAGLPSIDLTPAHLEHFFYCGTAEAPTALIGVELYGADALLRTCCFCAPATLRAASWPKHSSTGSVEDVRAFSADSHPAGHVNLARSAHECSLRSRRPREHEIDDIGHTDQSGP